MMYGATIWADSMRLPSHRKRIQSVQRLYALRVSSAYHTVSHLTASIIAGMVSFDLVAEKRWRLYRMRDKDQQKIVEEDTINL